MESSQIVWNSKFSRCLTLKNYTYGDEFITNLISKSSVCNLSALKVLPNLPRKPDWTGGRTWRRFYKPSPAYLFMVDMQICDVIWKFCRFLGIAWYKYFHSSFIKMLNKWWVTSQFSSCLISWRIFRYFDFEKQCLICWVPVSKLFPNLPDRTDGRTWRQEHHLMSPPAYLFIMKCRHATRNVANFLQFFGIFTQLS